MLDRMYKEYPPGEAPAALEALAGKIRAADAFVFVAGEYNWGVAAGPQEPDRPFPRGMVLAAGGDRQLFGRALRRRALRGWRGTASCRRWGWSWCRAPSRSAAIGHALDAEAEPIGDGGAALGRAFPRFADDLAWWTEAARAQRAVKAPPY